MQIVIAGGGFGGVKAARELAKNPKNSITLLSDKPDFQYFPALYNAATGHSRAQAWIPLGQIFALSDNVRVVIDPVASIDVAGNYIVGASGETYRFDRCIMALGTVTTYFGIDGLDTYAYGIKSAGEIRRLKQHLYEDVAEDHTLAKNYVIIGAGPTGVELSAAMRTYVLRLCRRYHVRRSGVRIKLIEAAPSVLPKLSPRAQKLVTKRLRKLGIDVLTNSKVESADADSLTVDGREIDSNTIIWTSGVANHPFFSRHHDIFKLSPNGRVEVDQYLRASERVYVIGDNAMTPYTGLAQTALHDAVFVAKNILREQRHQNPKPYRPVKPPVVVPVGNGWAVLEWHGLVIGGRIGSFIRRVADLLGYLDILTWKQAWRVWRSAEDPEDEYFAPRPVSGRRTND